MRPVPKPRAADFALAFCHCLKIFRREFLHGSSFFAICEAFLLTLIFAICEDYTVRIITQRKLREAYKKHPEWEASLVSWRRIAKAATWNNFSDVRQSWRNVDIVDSSVVFNIGHNKCRLLAFIGYRIHVVFVLHILSHAEYDKGGWKE